MTAAAALTPRQLQVIQLRATGASEKDVAAALGLSVQGIKNHAQAAYRRLGVESLPEAVHVLWLKDCWDNAA